MSGSGGFKAAHATGDDWEAVTRACLDTLLPLPEGANIGFLYLTDLMVDGLADILELLRAGTGIESWVGSTGIGVCASGVEYFDQPALVVMVGALPAGGFAVFDSRRDDLGHFVERNRGWLARFPGNFGVVHADPREPRLAELLASLGEASSSFLVGGLTSSRAAHGQVADEVTEGGLSGLLISGGVAVATGLTQGCTPIGPPREVTEAEGNILVRLDGRPALEVFKEDIGELLARDPRRVAGYIFAAVPVRGSDWGDYMVRNLTGIDPERQLVAIAEVVEPGDQVMFCRRDRAAAEEDLGRMLDKLKARLDGPPRGALYHTCLARGPNLFGTENEELGAIREALGEVPLVGFFGNGEVSHNRLYAYTGVLSLFT